MDRTGAEYEEHWSFVTPKAINIPEEENYIDYHISHFHKSKNLGSIKSLTKNPGSR